MKPTAMVSPAEFRSAWSNFSLKCPQICAALLLLVAGTLKAQTNLAISSFDFKAAVTWSNALSGHSYAVQRASVLETGAWSNVPGFSDISPTGSTMTVLIPVPGPTGFYRILDNGLCCTNNGGTNAPSAVSLGSLCGDVTGSPIITSGCGGGWFRVTISECNLANSIDLQATISLTSPTSADYDLYVYNTSFVLLASESDDNVCVGRADIASIDRTFDVIIEVRPDNAFSCYKWTLDVRRASSPSGCSMVP